MILSNKNDVWIIAYERSSFSIGRIKQDTLYLDSPSRIRSKAYGIDELVLTSPEMDFHYIIVKHGKEDWTTSRQFWLKHGKIINIDNGRTERFLDDALFGAEKAILYEQYISPEIQELIKMDVFDAARSASEWTSPTFVAWEKALDIEERYKQSIKFKRKIEL